MAGLTYAQFKEQIATLAVVPQDDSNFLTILPQAITYAELRMQREIDFLESSGAVIGTLPAGRRDLVFPNGTFVVSEQANLLLPAGATDPNNAERQPLTPTTKELLDSIYGNSSYRGPPEWFAPFNDNLFLVGPFADAEYSVEVIGTVRFPTLSETNPTNFISLYLPDLLVAAAMIFVSGYQRNYGSQADDPGQAISWEQQYTTLLQGANVEEARKKFEAGAWSSQGPAQIATPSR